MHRYFFQRIAKDCRRKRCLSLIFYNTTDITCWHESTYRGWVIHLLEQPPPPSSCVRVVYLFDTGIWKHDWSKITAGMQSGQCASSRLRPSE